MRLVSQHNAPQRLSLDLVETNLSQHLVQTAFDLIGIERSVVFPQNIKNDDVADS